MNQLFNSAEKIEIANIQIDTTKHIWLEMAFGGWAILNPAVAKKAKSYVVPFDRVDILYSDYPKNNHFNSLNKKRLESLKKLLPNLFSNPAIQFRIIKQTNCASKAEAKKLPHGILLHIVKSNQVEVVEDEKGIDYKDGIVETVTSVNETVELEKELISESSLIIPSGAMGKDSTIIKIFKRNAGLLKDSVVIITDLTYSMAPFTWQILHWQKQIRQSKKVLAHIFFNDGDKTHDKEKVLGKAGGIYVTETADLDSVSKLMAKVQKNGNGGDIPENDLEALLFAIENYPNAKEYVLIADAKSSIRDFELLSKINKPIRVFLARTDGSYRSIGGQYLDLAYQTNGSLFTESHDFPNKKSLEAPKEYLRELNEAYEKARGKN
ncbi:MAG: hypothetical protein ACJAWV_002057 [Flammeovirgaceae bacterium]|jgi:hypothetical protein